MIKNIYLIGGAPRTGKSTIAKLISSTYNIPYLSMDDVREFLKLITSEKLSPDLFYDKNMSIEQFYKVYSEPRQVFELERNQNKAAELGIESVLNSFCDWESVIIEGIGITPEFISRLSIKHNVSSVIFVVKNSDILTQRIYSNGLWDNVNKYPDIYKEKERVWADIYNKWFLDEAEKYKCNKIFIDNLSEDQILTKVKELFNL